MLYFIPEKARQNYWCVEFMYLVNNQVAIQPQVDLQPNNKTTDNQQFVAEGFQKEEHV